ncbi:MAG: DUF3037 domain-containing protein [SAR202 cluster bacterium]|nr:DUF3037 domain-containing protein [SAR202 cluster bacterium]
MVSSNKIPYEFRLIYYTRNAAAGERVNIGLIFWSPRIEYFWYKLNERYGRLSSIYPGFDGIGYRRLVASLNHVLGKLDPKAGRAVSHLEAKSDSFLHEMLSASVFSLSNVVGI